MKSSEMHSTESTEQDREILYALRKRDPNCVDISVGTLEHVIDRLDEADLDERLCAGLDIYYKATARRLIDSSRCKNALERLCPSQLISLPRACAQAELASRKTLETALSSFCIPK